MGVQRWLCSARAPAARSAPQSGRRPALGVARSSWQPGSFATIGLRHFASQGRQEGTVKMWNEEKGFGFITPAGGGDDVFVHRTAVGDGVQLTAGGSVTYEPEWDDRKKKDRAADVQLAKGGSPAGGAAGGDAAPVEAKGRPVRSERQQERPTASTAASAKTASRHNIASAADKWVISTEPMGPDPVGRAMVHHRLQIRSDAPAGSSAGVRKEEFQICGNGTWDMRLYPEGQDREEVVLLKPGGPGSRAASDRGKGHGRNWAVEGKPGTAVDIFFDPQTMMVTCEVASH